MSIEEIRNRCSVDDDRLRYQTLTPIKPKRWRSIAVDAHLDRAELLRVIDAVDELIDELSNDEAANVQECGLPSKHSLYFAGRLLAILRGEGK